MSRCGRLVESARRNFVESVNRENLVLQAHDVIKQLCRFRSVRKQYLRGEALFVQKVEDHSISLRLS